MATTVRVYKQVEFSAGHFLRGMREGHPCADKHGHTYKVEVWVRALRYRDDLPNLQVPELRNGMVIDFGDISSVVKALDHKFLNDLPDFERFNPTAENIALFIFNVLNNLSSYVVVERVRVWETSTAYAEVES